METSNPSLLSDVGTKVGTGAKFTGTNLVKGGLLALGAICAVALAREFLPALVKKAMGDEKAKTS